MARLASAEKAGFYPLPRLVTDLIGSYLAAPDGGRILDPCAGAGVAVATLAERLALECYAIELHQERARAARTRVAALGGRDLPHTDPHERRVLSGDYRLATVARQGVNLLYLNPPYDDDHVDGRLEYGWLRDTRDWLPAGGVLVYVVRRRCWGWAWWLAT